MEQLVFDKWLEKIPLRWNPRPMFPAPSSVIFTGFPQSDRGRLDMENAFLLGF
jgi:hypothetical protein